MLKIGIFIDLANLQGGFKKMGKKLNFEKLLQFISEKFSGKIIYKSVYFAFPAQNTRNYNVDGIHQFGRLLKRKFGFQIRKKQLKRIEVRDQNQKIIKGENGEPIFKEKGNLDIELTIDVMKEYSNFDLIIIFSGDSDFECLLDFLQQNGKIIFIFSTKGNISKELKLKANGYYDFCKIPEIWG